MTSSDHRRIRIVWVLAALAVVLAVTVGGLIVYILTDRGARDDSTGKSQRRQFPTTLTASLRDTVESMYRETNGLATEGEQFDVALSYAAPGCKEMMKGMAETFGIGSEPADDGVVTIVDVTENGDRGTVVTRTDGEEDESTEWVKTGGKWRFTCGWTFGNDDDPPSATEDASPTISVAPTDTAELDDESPADAEYTTEESETSEITSPYTRLQPGNPDRSTEQGREQQVDDGDYLPVQRWDPCTAPGATTTSSYDGADYVCVQDDRAYGGHAWRTWQPAS